MPLVRISLAAGKPAGYRRKIGDIVHQTMVDTINVPADDRFQLISEHVPENFIHAVSYLGNDYTEDLIVIQITLNEGRSVELKKKFYKTLVERLAAAIKIRPQDVFISLVEVKKENWSFGSGEMQYDPTK